MISVVMKLSKTSSITVWKAMAIGLGKDQEMMRAEATWTNNFMLKGSGMFWSEIELTFSCFPYQSHSRTNHIKNVHTTWSFMKLTEEMTEFNMENKTEFFRNSKGSSRSVCTRKCGANARLLILEARKMFFYNGVHIRVSVIEPNPWDQQEEKLFMVDCKVIFYFIFNFYLHRQIGIPSADLLLSCLQKPELDQVDV